jgi:CTP:molybdopterin cytidylyltransferase MocA
MSTEWITGVVLAAGASGRLGTWDDYQKLLAAVAP